MTPAEFTARLADVIGQQPDRYTEITVNDLRSALGATGHTHKAQEKWAEGFGLTIVATRRNGGGNTIYVRYVEALRALRAGRFDAAIKVSDGVRQYKVRKGQTDTASECLPPAVLAPQPVNAEDIAFARQQAIYKRLDDMQAKLQAVLNFEYANQKRLRCLGRKLDAIVKAWDIVVPEPTATENEIDAVIDAFAMPQDD